MIFFTRPSKKLTPAQQQIVRAHWEWAGGYAMIWIVATVLIFGGIFLMLEYLEHVSAGLNRGIPLKL